MSYSNFAKDPEKRHEVTMLNLSILSMLWLILVWCSWFQLPDKTCTAALGALWQPPWIALTVTDKVKPQTRLLIEQLVPVVLQDRLILVLTASTRKDSASGLAAQVTFMAPPEQFIWTCTFWGAQGAGRRCENQPFQISGKSSANWHHGVTNASWYQHHSLYFISHSVLYHCICTW